MKVRTVEIELVGGPRCGDVLKFGTAAVPPELPELATGGRYLLTDRATANYPYRPLYEYEPVS